MADDKTLAKVQKLVRLATNEAAAPEEARTAALEAVKLMKEHKLYVGPERPKNGAKLFDFKGGPLETIVVGVVLSKVLGKVLD